jgi:hypothetical protein
MTQVITVENLNGFPDCYTFSDIQPDLPSFLSVVKRVLGIIPGRVWRYQGTALKSAAGPWVMWWVER